MRGGAGRRQASLGARPRRDVLGYPERGDECCVLYKRDPPAPPFYSAVIEPRINLASLPISPSSSAFGG